MGFPVGCTKTLHGPENEQKGKVRLAWEKDNTYSSPGATKIKGTQQWDNKQYSTANCSAGGFVPYFKNTVLILVDGSVLCSSTDHGHSELVLPHQYALHYQ